jgi:D-alanyl-lipoteichoic acid acyltransferase DltB (MBOAT superfamily)
VLASFEILVLVMTLTVPAYWLAGPASNLARDLILVATSMVLLYALSPAILVVTAFCLALTLGLWAAWRLGAGINLVKALSWLLFAPLVFVEVVPAEMFVQGFLGQDAKASPGLVNWAYLGVGYTTIRCFLIFRESLAAKRFGLMPAIVALTFFGSYPAGPIAGVKPFLPESRKEGLSPTTTLVALSRIGWGGALLLVAAPKLAAFDLATRSPVVGSVPVAWLDLYRDFIVLYLDFSGYSSLAIGCTLLYGITLPENFRRPLLARSIQEFWQRWHLSLGAFISRYLFQPLVRATGRPKLAIFAAFVLVGLWHEISWPYFLWGVGHGAALALHMELAKRPKTDKPRSEASNLVAVVQGFLTITYVALLSKLANAETLSGSFTVLGELVGLR